MALVTPALEACPSCGARPGSPLLCEGCGALLEPGRTPTPFAVLGLEPAYALDAAAMKKRFLALSRALHPDFHGTADAATRRLAEDSTAALNAAFQLLSDDAQRADWLVRALDGPREDQDRAMPAPFLDAVLEWNEAIESARHSAAGSSERAALQGLSVELRKAREQGMQRVADLLTPLPPAGSPVLRDVRQELNALRYLDRALRELAELRLARS